MYAWSICSQIKITCIQMYRYMYSACTNIFNRTFGLFSDSLFQDWWYKWIEKNLYSIICFYYLQRIASLLFLWVVLYWKACLMKLISNSGQTSWFVDYYDYMHLILLQLLVLLLKYRATCVLLHIFVVFIPNMYSLYMYYLHMYCSIIL